MIGVFLLLHKTAYLKNRKEGNNPPLSPAARTVLIPSWGDGYPMQSQYTSCRLTCHRCSHAWTYMGIRLASLNRSARPVKVQCPRCKARVAMDVKNAR
jgi:hypothetical protein